MHFFKVVGLVVVAVLGMNTLASFMKLGDPKATKPAPPPALSYERYDETGTLEDIAKLEELPKRTTEQLKKMRNAYLWLAQKNSHIRLYAQRADELVTLIAESEKADIETKKAELAAAKEASIPPSIRAMRSVGIDLVKWERGGFGAVVEVSVYIKNESDMDIKDISIYCEHYANSGTKIDSSTRVIYDIVPHKSSHVFENVNMGFVASQATSGKCKILDVKV